MRTVINHGIIGQEFRAQKLTWPSEPGCLAPEACRYHLNQLDKAPYLKRQWQAFYSTEAPRQRQIAEGTMTAISMELHVLASSPRCQR
jgi:hypothetical protein